MNEAETRKQLIDRQLTRAGWRIASASDVVCEYGIPLNVNSPGILMATEARPAYGRMPSGFRPNPGEYEYADYVLLGKEGHPLAVIEAKKTSRDAEVGREQARQYAVNLSRALGCDEPFIFYTNGHETYFWDQQHTAPRRIYGYPTRAELERIRSLRKRHRPLGVQSIDTAIAGRSYQLEAIRRIMESLAEHRRKFLLVMATGTGKTRTCAALVDALSRSGYVERVLFLVDRIALQEQARDAFKEHVPRLERWPEEGEARFATDRRVYFMTYPSMLNLIENNESSYLSPFFFDLIVADESHRSIYNHYRQILDYFDAPRLGLTATPTDKVDHDTFAMFDCTVGVPTFAFSYEEAVAHKPPYLCSFESLNVRSRFQEAGIHGSELPEQVQAQLLARGIDPNDIDFEGTDLERKVTNSGTNVLLIREFMDECLKDADGALPGKTIIFALSKAHANRLQTVFDTLYPEQRGRLSAVIVSGDSRVHGPGGLLAQFKEQSMPRIAISVDMLDTGIDVREVVNLVFAKPVYSFTKFWQMIGRGTRLLEGSKIKPWCPAKDKFLIFDCWANFAFFRMNPAGRTESQSQPVAVLLFRARLDLLDAALTTGNDEVAALAKGLLRADLQSLPQNNVVVLEAASKLTRVADDEFWEFLRDDELKFLRLHIAPLLRARSEADADALRFERLVMELLAAQLRSQRDKQAALREQIVEQVGELSLRVNTVAKQKPLIREVLSGAYFQTLTPVRCVDLSTRLAPLMKHRREKSADIIKLDLEDLLHVKEWVTFGPEHERMPVAAYREQVEARVRELVEENPVLKKLQQGAPVEENEIRQLAELLRNQAPYATEDLLRKVYDHKAARFAEILRQILTGKPLRPWAQTVGEAFDRFIGQHGTLSSQQLRFLSVLRTFLVERGHVTRRDLTAAPFTQVHPQGILGLFQPAQIDEILKLTESLAA